MSLNGIGFGSRTLDANDIVSLYVYQSGMAINTFAPLQDDGSNYVVPAAKNLVIDFIICNTTSASNPENLEFGYADDATGTNYVKKIPERILSEVENTSAMIRRYTTECLIRIPTGKYPVIKNTAGNLDVACLFRGVCA